MILLSSVKAGACSYMLPSKVRALKALDLLFSGQVVAVYLNGKQSSTEEFPQMLRETQSRMEVLLKIIPHDIYLGPDKKLFEIRSAYDPNNTCQDGQYLFPLDKLWGATLGKTGTFQTNAYQDMVAKIGLPFILSLHTYQKSIQHVLAAPQANKKAIHVLEQEAWNIEKILNRDTKDITIAFGLTGRQLTLLPTEVLRKRHDFLLEAGLMEQASKTQIIIAFRD
jgi:hypothetical protein